MDIQTGAAIFFGITTLILGILTLWQNNKPSIKWEQIPAKVSILKAFLSDKRPRSKSGIAQETRIDEKTVNKLLNELAKDRLVVKNNREKGRWEITQNGRKFLEILKTLS